MKWLFASLLLLALPAAAQEKDHKKPEALRVCGRPGVVPPCVKYAPKPIRNPDPEYSAEARRKKISATAKLWIVVEVDGTVDDVVFENRAGYGLDEKALEALKQWKFEPGRMEDDSLARTKLEVDFTWRLY